MEINTSKLNKTEFEKLKFLFVQCKWLYNYLLNEEVDIFKFDTKTRNIFIYGNIRKIIFTKCSRNF